MAGVPGMETEVSALGLDDLVGADREFLDHLFSVSPVPDISEFEGAANGRVFYLPDTDVSSVLAVLREPLLLWRGKVFEQGRAGTARGLNRICGWPRELQWFVFEAYPGTSELDGEPVIVIDHDFPGNPRRFRRMHDEVRRVRPGLFLASSHARTREGLRFICYFGFEFPPTAIH